MHSHLLLHRSGFAIDTERVDVCVQLFTMTEVVHSPPSPGSRSAKPAQFLHDPSIVARETCEEVSSLHIMSSSNGSPAVQSAAPSSVTSPRHEVQRKGSQVPAAPKRDTFAAAAGKGMAAGGDEQGASESRFLDDKDRSNSVISCASCAASDYGQAE